jgi:hypothetical protein
MCAEWEQGYVGILAALVETQITVLTGVGTNTGWDFEVRAENRDAIGDFHGYCADHNIPIDTPPSTRCFPYRKRDTS